MRRFFVWSALAALVGLLIAGGGYWAYWQFHARFQPVTITRHQGAIQTLLDGLFAGPDLAEDMISALEARAIWARFGL